MDVRTAILLEVLHHTPHSSLITLILFLICASLATPFNLVKATFCGVYTLGSCPSRQYTAISYFLLIIPFLPHPEAPLAASRTREQVKICAT